MPDSRSRSLSLRYLVNQDYSSQRVHVRILPFSHTFYLDHLAIQRTSFMHPVISCSWVPENSCPGCYPGRDQRGQISGPCDRSRQQMVSLRWIDGNRAWRTDKSLCVCVYVGRSPQEEAKLPMEPIVEENIEMPEAQTDTERGDMLRYFIQYAWEKHIPRSSITFCPGFM